MPVAHLLLISIFPAVVVIAAVRDATSYTIPNWLSAALALAFFPAALGVGLAPATIGLCAASGAAALAAGVAMFAAGWIGGGDAKLFAACALWLGLGAIGAFLAWTALFGGGLAVALLLARRSPVAAFRGPPWVGRLLEPAGEVPYGVAIAAGAMAAFPSSAIFQALGA